MTDKVQDYESIMEELPEKTKDFLKFHGIQLMSIGFPANAQLIEQLYCKLEKEIFDSCEYFSLMDNQDEEQYELYTKQQLNKEEHVFLIDHQFSFKLSELRQQLYQNEALVTRLENMLKYSNIKKNVNNHQPDNLGLGNLEECYDNMQIENPLKYIINKNTLCLSFYNNNISNLEWVDQLLSENEQVVMLWLNMNPLDEGQLWQMVEQKYPQIQLLNSMFTQNVDTFAIKMVSLQMNKYAYDNTSDHQLVYLDCEARGFFQLPLHKIQQLAEVFTGVKIINLKGNDCEQEQFQQTIEQLCCYFPQLEEVELDNNQVEWLFTLAPCQLQKVNGFYLNRGQPNEQDMQVRQLLHKIYTVSQNYRLQQQNTLDYSLLWYLMDEIGSAMLHSDTSNMQVHPLLFNPHNSLQCQHIPYSICWNIQDISTNTLVTRDYLKGITEQQFRSARLYAWYNIPHNYFLDKYTLYLQQLQDNYNQHKQHYQQLEQQEQHLQPLIPTTQLLKVYTDDPIISQALDPTLFTLVDSSILADIIYLVHQSIDSQYEQDHPHQLLNQFPYESCLTMKHNLAKTIYKVLGNTTLLQQTYDLSDQLDCFMGDYFLNQQQHSHNLWIIKHPNLARSLDMTITNDLTLIHKLTLNTPRIAQKYITNPVCINNKKVDLRFILIVRSVTPLRLFLFNKFWVRSANRPYSLDERCLSEYDTHFTVMNYGAGEDMQTIYCEEFIEQFEQQYNYDWQTIYKQIKQDLKSVLRCVQLVHPGMQDDHCRAIYGVDYMIEAHSMQPKLLEITYSPDCIRANNFYPSFWNDVFSCLFKDQINPLIEPL